MSLSIDLVGGVLGFLFTLMILSYLIGDNPLFKIAVYLFVGVASGYAASVIFVQVLYYRLFQPTFAILQTGAYGIGIVQLVFPWLGVGFIFMKVSPRLAGISRIAMAFLVGVGAAVTLAGAVIGTLIPQVSATINFFDQTAAAARNVSAFEVMGNGAILLAGVITSLAYFHFGARKKPDGSTKRFALIDLLALAGQFFIGITLGTIFAGVYAAALTALIERISSFFTFFSLLRTTFGL